MHNRCAPDIAPSHQCLPAPRETLLSRWGPEAPVPWLPSTRAWVGHPWAVLPGPGPQNGPRRLQGVRRAPLRWGGAGSSPSAQLPPLLLRYVFRRRAHPKTDARSASQGKKKPGRGHTGGKAHTTQAPPPATQDPSSGWWGGGAGRWGEHKEPVPKAPVHTCTPKCVAKPPVRIGTSPAMLRQARDRAGPGAPGACGLPLLCPKEDGAAVCPAAFTRQPCLRTA